MGPSTNLYVIQAGNIEKITANKRIFLLGTSPSSILKKVSMGQCYR